MAVPSEVERGREGSIPRGLVSSHVQDASAASSPASTCSPAAPPPNTHTTHAHTNTTATTTIRAARLQPMISSKLGSMLELLSRT